LGGGCELTGSGQTACTGAVVDACAESNAPALCALAPGCRWMNDACTGTPVSCDEIFAQNQCVNQGCEWSDVSALECTGTPTPCAELGEEALCETQSGCSWN
jgi:hypothetical protein